jgi:hypothetical protein
MENAMAKPNRPFQLERNAYYLHELRLECLNQIVSTTRKKTGLRSITCPVERRCAEVEVNELEFCNRENLAVLGEEIDRHNALVKTLGYGKTGLKVQRLSSRAEEASVELPFDQHDVAAVAACPMPEFVEPPRETSRGSRQLVGVAGRDRGQDLDLDLELEDADADADRRQVDPVLAGYLARAASILD